MPRRVGTSRNPAKHVRAATRTLLAGAVDRLAHVAAPPADDDTTVHEVRKRCKEARALARLLGRPSGHRAERFDAAVRDAGRAVSTLRDEQAVAGSLETLSSTTTGRARAAVAIVRAAGRIADPRLANPADDAGIAAHHLATALRELERWRPQAGIEPIADGIERSYRTARRRLASLREHPDDEHMHEWRKAVKRLWYQTAGGARPRTERTGSDDRRTRRARRPAGRRPRPRRGGRADRGRARLTRRRRSRSPTPSRRLGLDRRSCVPARCDWARACSQSDPGRSVGGSSRTGHWPATWVPNPSGRGDADEHGAMAMRSRRIGRRALALACAGLVPLACAAPPSVTDDGATMDAPLPDRSSPLRIAYGDDPVQFGDLYLPDAAGAADGRPWWC